MGHCCEALKIDLQMHEEAAIFSVDAILRKESYLVATGGGDKAVRLWKYLYSQTGEQKDLFVYRTASSIPYVIEHMATLKRHQGSVNCIRFSPCKKYLVTTGDTGSVYAWDIDKILSSALEGGDLVYTGQPIRVRDADGTDIYDLGWMKDKIIIGTSGGQIEIYSLVKRSIECSDKSVSPILSDSNNNPNNAINKITTTIKFRVVEGRDPERYEGKLIMKRKMHRDIIQGVSCTEKTIASYGNDRVLKIFESNGKMVKKFNRKSFITDKHPFFFRRMSFTEDESLYIPACTDANTHVVLFFKAPEYSPSKAIGPFLSSPGNVHIAGNTIFVSEGRNIYVFNRNQGNTLLFRVLDCAFLPITDICTLYVKDNVVSVLVSSSDGFLTNLIIKLSGDK